MFVQTHIQRNRHNHPHHHHLPPKTLDHHKSNRSLNISSNLNLSNNSILGGSKVSNGHGSLSTSTTSGIKKTGSFSHLDLEKGTKQRVNSLSVTRPVETVVKQAEKNPEIPKIISGSISGESIKGKGPKSRAIVSDRKRKQSLYRRDFSFDQEDSHWNLKPISSESTSGSLRGSHDLDTSHTINGSNLAKTINQNEDRRTRSLTVAGSPPIINNHAKKSISTESDSILIQQSGNGKRLTRNLTKLNYLLSLITDRCPLKSYRQNLSTSSVAVGSQEKVDNSQDNVTSNTQNGAELKSLASKSNIKLMLNFLHSLISYQLETLRQLVRSDHDSLQFYQQQLNMYTGFTVPYTEAHHLPQHGYQCSASTLHRRARTHTHQHNHSHQSVPVSSFLTGHYPGSTMSTSIDHSETTFARKPNQNYAKNPMGASERISPIAGFQSLSSNDSIQYPRHYNFTSVPTPEHYFGHGRSLTSQRSLCDHDSNGSLQEDALSQFIINISDQPDHRLSGNTNHTFGAQDGIQGRRRQVPRQVTTTGDQSEAFWLQYQAHQWYPARSSDPVDQTGARFPAIAINPQVSNYENLHPSRGQFVGPLAMDQRRRNLLDKKYSNSWDCNNSPVTSNPQQTPPSRQHNFTSVDSSVQLDPVTIASKLTRGLLKNSTIADDACLAKGLVRVNTVGSLIKQQKGNEETAKRLELSPATTNQLRPSSQDSNASQTASKKLGSLSPGKLSLAGAKRRFGFRQKTTGGLSSLSVQRSEEIFPFEAARQLIRELTFNSMTDSGNESASGNNISHSIDPRNCFVEGLGKGQIASRQALVSPYLGDIQLSICDQRGLLEVEVVRARQLQIKPGAKVLPSPYVKIYLMRDKKCIEKCKTIMARRTLNPLFQQRIIVREDYTNCILQIIVWADYGKKDRKSLMGIVQVDLSELDISNIVIGWYRLLNSPSMASSINSSKALRHSVLPRQQTTQK